MLVVSLNEQTEYLLGQPEACIICTEPVSDLEDYDVIDVSL